MRYVLLPDGFCGLTVKRKTRESLEVPPEEDDAEDRVKKLEGI
jgi:hypothetical protein